MESAPRNARRASEDRVHHARSTRIPSENEPEVERLGSAPADHRCCRLRLNHLPGSDPTPVPWRKAAANRPLAHRTQAGEDQPADHGHPAVLGAQEVLAHWTRHVEISVPRTPAAPRRGHLGRGRGRGLSDHGSARRRVRRRPTRRRPRRECLLARGNPMLRSRLSPSCECRTDDAVSEWRWEPSALRKGDAG